MKYYRFSMNMCVLNLFCIALFIPSMVLIYLLGISSSVNFTCLILYFLWMFLHEFLHGLGFYICGASHDKIVYGANLEKGIFYCMCKDKISKKSIIISLLFPFFFIGIFTLIFGFFINNSFLIILSLFNIAGCAGDLAMFFSFLKLPGFDYLDLDDCTGFVLVSSNDLSKYKLFGIKLVEEGNYSPSLSANDYHKFTISKLSWVIFSFMILFLIISIVM